MYVRRKKDEKKHEIPPHAKHTTKSPAARRPRPPGRTFFFPLFSLPSHLFSSPFYYLSLLVVTQIRGHIADSSPPLPTTARALHLYREKISALSSLVDSRRIYIIDSIHIPGTHSMLLYGASQLRRGDKRVLLLPYFVIVGRHAHQAKNSNPTTVC